MWKYNLATTMWLPYHSLLAILCEIMAKVLDLNMEIPGLHFSSALKFTGLP